MSDRFPVMKPPGRRNVPPTIAQQQKTSWGQRIAGTAALMGALGGVYNSVHSDRRHQDELNASVPDRDERTRRDRLERARERSSVQSAPTQGPGSQEVWDRLQQAWREAPEEDATVSEAEPVHEPSEREIASETGRRIIFEMMQSGEYLRYFGRAREFDNEVMRRIAEEYGIAYDPANVDRQPFIAARYAIREELDAQSRVSLDHARELQSQGRAAEADITNAIHIRALGSNSDGAMLALRNGRGDMAVDCIRQSRVDIHDPMNGYVWGEITPPNAPGATEEALNQTWRYLDDHDRISIERRIQESITSLEYMISAIRQEIQDGPERRRDLASDVARYQRSIEEYQGLLHRWF